MYGDPVESHVVLEEYIPPTEVSAFKIEFEPNTNTATPNNAAFRIGDIDESFRLRMQRAKDKSIFSPFELRYIRMAHCDLVVTIALP